MYGWEFVQFIIGIVVLFIVSFIIYILTSLAKDFFNIRRDIKRRITEYQQKLIETHVAEVENIYIQMRSWRHDYHSHIQTMMAFLVSETDTVTEHLEYLNKLNDDLTSVDTTVKTGNITTDAILNSKLSLAASKNISVTANAALPYKFKLSEIELCVIIGNMLDNSIEACMKLPDAGDRFIKVDIYTHKSMLYISVLNSTDGTEKKQGARYISTKELPSRAIGRRYGFGLMSIDRIVAKHDGFINRQNENGVFTTEIMLPL